MLGVVGDGDGGTGGVVGGGVNGGGGEEGCHDASEPATDVSCAVTLLVVQNCCPRCFIFPIHFLSCSILAVRRGSPAMVLLFKPISAEFHF
jgi:hypothetical protein